MSLPHAGKDSFKKMVNAARGGIVDERAVISLVYSAFNQITGINVHVTSTVICITCVVYTVLGGLKAVIHTGAWQILAMFMSMIVVVTISCFKADSIENVFQTASEGGLLIFADERLARRPTFAGSVMQTVGHYYGVPGLFIAVVFGAALSSLSVILLHW
uniref:Uncharacterized protein n=1 Tax=Glossina pallidipes TaxID=7398 RepID=A0A1A9ZP70_GLOPL